jgi:hypothetical protein
MKGRLSGISITRRKQDFNAELLVDGALALEWRAVVMDAARGGDVSVVVAQRTMQHAPRVDKGARESSNVAGHVKLLSQPGARVCIDTRKCNLRESA